jgi:hypothetical protein
VNRNIPLTTRPAIAALAAVLWLAGPAAAAPLVGAAEAIASDPRSGFALDGLDPVTFFLPGGPRPGRRDLELLWGGAAWRFAMQANREAFRLSPEAYAPQFGGHDAEGAARGLPVEADPALFAVVDGRLYLFRTPAGRAAFLADPAMGEVAHARWPEVERTLVGP